MAAEDEQDWDKNDESKLQLARQGLRDYVVGNDWAPDVDAVESRHKGMAVRGTEARIITVSKQALRKYRVEGIYLLKRCVRETCGQKIEYASGVTPGVKPIDFAQWLAGVKPRISKATWRAYKQAGLWVIEHWPDATVDLVERADAYQWLAAQDASGAKGSREATGLPEDAVILAKAKRLRSIPVADLEAILSEVSRRGKAGGRKPSDAKTAWIVGDWLVAAVATGLRPVEWRQARLVFQGDFAWPSFAEDYLHDWAKQGVDAFDEIPPSWTPPQGKAFLIVHSTKHSNNRGNQAVRTLEITDFPLEIVQSIARMVWRGAGRTGGWPDLQNLCTKLLRRVQADLWPRRRTTISFYSARHQAMANWKESIGTFAAAVLAGHGIPDGPERYYAARANSWQRRKDDKGKTGGLGPSSKVVLLAQTAAPGRAQGEIESLVEKAGELGMAKLAKRNPFAEPKPQTGAPEMPPSPDTMTPFDF
jgi:hypothetical protein